MVRVRMLVLGLAVGAVPLSGQATVASVSWLAGCWQQEARGRTTLEQWMPPAGGMMLGGSRTVADGQARMFEFLRLHQQDGVLVYTADPAGQAKTEFRSTAVSDTVLVVENPEHDFPTRISYRRVGSDSLAVRVEGPGPDGMRGFGIGFARVACVP